MAASVGAQTCTGLLERRGVVHGDDLDAHPVRGRTGRETLQMCSQVLGDAAARHDLNYPWLRRHRLRSLVAVVHPHLWLVVALQQLADEQAPPAQ
jgi:hypothetical protein